MEAGTREANCINAMNHSLLPAVGNATLPAKYEAAKVALAECNQMDECKDWADKSQALASYARQSQDKELENTAMRIRARAIRRCGELLQQVEKANGKNRGERGHEAPFCLTRKTAATAAGLSSDQAKDALRVSNIPQESFEKQVESDEPPTVTKLAEQGKGSAKGAPLYEKLGMTKKAFQAGMYFRGELESHIKSMNLYDPQDVADGSTKEQRKGIKHNLELISKYHSTLKLAL